MTTEKNRQHLRKKNESSNGIEHYIHLKEGAKCLLNLSIELYITIIYTSILIDVCNINQCEVRKNFGLELFGSYRKKIVTGSLHIDKQEV